MTVHPVVFEILQIQHYFLCMLVVEAFSYENFSSNALVTVNSPY